LARLGKIPVPYRYYVLAIYPLDGGANLGGSGASLPSRGFGFCSWAVGLSKPDSSSGRTQVFADVMGGNPTLRVGPWACFRLPGKP